MRNDTIRYDARRDDTIRDRQAVVVEVTFQFLGDFFNKLFLFTAFIPGPIIMGALIDSACRLWNTQACGAKGACLVYDLDSLRIKMHLYVAIVKTAACVMDVYVSESFLHTI
jgi:hypothetical protein